MATYKKASDIRVAVVGYGGAFNMGRKHLEECRAAGMTPTAVVDLDQARLAIAESDFPGIETYTSVNKMQRSRRNARVPANTSWLRSPSPSPPPSVIA